jgi:hypothetical protein
MKYESMTPVATYTQASDGIFRTVISRIGAHHDLEQSSYTSAYFFACTFGDICRRNSRYTTDTQTRNDPSRINLSQTI